MVRATPAPKAKYQSLLLIPYLYAAILAILAVVQLMGMGGFNFASIVYTTAGLPVMIVTVATLEIFAVPFLLRFSLSPLARFFSAVFALAAPFFVLGNMLYGASEGLITIAWYEIAGGALLIALGVISFVVLSGPKALTFNTRK